MFYMNLKISFIQLKKSKFFFTKSILKIVSGFESSFVHLMVIQLNQNFYKIVYKTIAHLEKYRLIYSYKSERTYDRNFTEYITGFSM